MRLLFCRSDLPFLRGFALLALCSLATAMAQPVAMIRTDTQCPVSLDSRAPPKAREESSVLVGALLTSAADFLVSTGVSYIKTKLDPSVDQFEAKVVYPHDGLFDANGHNRRLNCLIVALHDSSLAAVPELPLNESRFPDRAVAVDAAFAAEGNGSRYEKLFGVAGGGPLLYFEAIRRFSVDGEAFVYEPVYAYVAKPIKPHWLSAAPVWNLTITWKALGSEQIGSWDYSFQGKTPFETTSVQMNSSSQGWSKAPVRDKEAAAGKVNTPFNIVVDIKEHRTATLFSKALLQAVTDNEAALLSAARDRYPWRKSEVRAAVNQAEQAAADEARTTAESYLSGLETYQADCAAVSSEVKIASCALRYQKLMLDHTKITVAADKYKLLSDGARLPPPQVPGK